MNQNICERCEKRYTFEKGKNTKRFCCIKCSNTRVITEVVREKITKGNKRAWESKTEEQRRIFGEKVKKSQQKRSHTYLKNILSRPFEDLPRQTKYKRVLIEQCGCCLHCKNSHWMGTPITLEIDHINGINTDNSRENLRYLCPNCHSQTPTWRGRNNTGLLNSKYKNNQPNQI